MTEGILITKIIIITIVGTTRTIKTIII